MLSGKAAVVTGAASGIGKAICSRFLDEGAKVFMVDRNHDMLQSTAMEFQQRGKEKSFKTLVGDVALEDSAITAFNSASESFSQPSTVLVNCAGGGLSSLIKNASLTDFNHVLGINLVGVFTFTKHFLKGLEYGKGFPSLNASIVNIASMAGKVGMDRHASYAAAKSGVIAFTKSTCMEVGRYGIRCNAVLPGFIETPLINELSRSYIEASVKMNPMQRLGQPHEIASACLFLASDESSYVNGAALEVSGGLMA